jgi:hypothetical protein
MGSAEYSLGILPPSHRAEFWRQPPSGDADFALRATRYLGVLRDISLQPGWIGLNGSPTELTLAFNWIGQHIHQLNQRLHSLLQEGLACFEPEQLPPVQVLAAPILATVGIDGFCNLQVQPITLLIDPSRVVPPDWTNLVIHELAHALVRSAGHSTAFRDMLSFLCLAVDLPCPPPDASNLEVLRYWPPCRSNGDEPGFWLGGQPTA